MINFYSNCFLQGLPFLRGSCRAFLACLLLSFSVLFTEVLQVLAAVCSSVLLIRLTRLLQNALARKYSFGLLLLALQAAALTPASHASPIVSITDEPYPHALREENIRVNPTNNTTLAELLQAIALAEPAALRAGYIVSPEVANLRGFGFYYNGSIASLWRSLAAYFAQGGASGACLDVDFTGFLVFRACPRGQPVLNNIPPRGLPRPRAGDATNQGAGSGGVGADGEVVR